MNHLKCRSEDVRKNIVKDYKIKLIYRGILLKGRTKKSDAGDVIKNEYYEFLCTCKKTSKDFSIICGNHVGKSLIRLSGIENIKLFNPLKLDNTSNKSVTVNNSKNRQWDLLSLELYNAINILSIYWDTSITGILYEIKSALEKYPYNPPYLKKIIIVNKCISADKNHLTISKMILDLKKENPNMKNFQFDKINNLLEQENIESFF